MVFGGSISEKEVDQQQPVFIKEWKNVDDLAQQIIENSYLRKVHYHGDKLRDFTRQQTKDTADYIACLENAFKDNEEALAVIAAASKIVWKAPQNTPP